MVPPGRRGSERKYWLMTHREGSAGGDLSYFLHVGSFCQHSLFLSGLGLLHLHPGATPSLGLSSPYSCCSPDHAVCCSFGVRELHVGLRTQRYTP